MRGASSPAAHSPSSVLPALHRRHTSLCVCVWILPTRTPHFVLFHARSNSLRSLPVKEFIRADQYVRQCTRPPLSPLPVAGLRFHSPQSDLRPSTFSCVKVISRSNPSLTSAPFCSCCCVSLRFPHRSLVVDAERWRFSCRSCALFLSSCPVIQGRHSLIKTMVEMLVDSVCRDVGSGFPGVPRHGNLRRTPGTAVIRLAAGCFSHILVRSYVGIRPVAW